jgi:hypothetical protein
MMMIDNIFRMSLRKGSNGKPSNRYLAKKQNSKNGKNSEKCTTHQQNTGNSSIQNSRGSPLRRLAIITSALVEHKILETDDRKFLRAHFTPSFNTRSRLDNPLRTSRNLEADFPKRPVHSIAKGTKCWNAAGVRNVL